MFPFYIPAQEVHGLAQKFKLTHNNTELIQQALLSKSSFKLLHTLISSPAYHNFSRVYPKKGAQNVNGQVCQVTCGVRYAYERYG